MMGPCQALKTRKGGVSSKTEYLMMRDLEHVLAALTESNRLVCRVCLHTGLRLSDVLSLQTEQLKPRFWVTESKTKKRRMVGLPEPLLTALQQQAGEKWVFPHRIDPLKRHRTRQAVWSDVKRAAKAFRLTENVGPHSLRKVYAVDLLSRYGDIDRVKRALNHGSVTVTLLYAMADKVGKARAASRSRRKTGLV